MVTNFKDVDRSDDPAAHVGYLEYARTLNQVREYKERTFDLLGLRPGARVLDLGCGTGDDVRAMAGRVAPGGLAVGVDFSEEMVRVARNRGGANNVRLEFRVSDAHRLEFASATFDAARADRVLQHVEDPRTAIAELARVTRSGGRVAVTEPDWDTFIIDAADRVLTQQIQTARFDLIPRRQVGRELVRFFADAGLTGIDVLPTTLFSRDLESGEGLYGVVGQARRMQEQGTLTRAEVDAWVEALAAAEAAGRFFCAVTLFSVVGQKS